MANRTTDIRGGEERTAEGRGRGRRFLVFILVLAAVLGLALAAAYRDGTGFDVLRRYLNYGSAASSGEQRYRYDSSPNNRFAALGNQLVVLSDTSLRLLDKEGGETWSTQVKMTSPALCQGGDRVAAYDIGGRSLYVLDRSGCVFTLEMEEDEPLISAALNARGMLTVTAQRKNAKGAVYVYSAALDREPLCRVISGERFVTEGRVSNDGNTLAVVRLGQESGVFVSSMAFYDLRQPGEIEASASCDLRDALVLAAAEQGGGLVTVSDTCVSCVSYGGRETGSYGYGGSHLRSYSLGEDFTALLLNRYQAGNVGRLVTLDAKGEELGSLDVHEEIRGLSAAGRYLAVLYTDRLVVYNENLQVYATLRGISNVSGALMRTDGSALVLSPESASQFLP